MGEPKIEAQKPQNGTPPPTQAMVPAPPAGAATLEIAPSGQVVKVGFDTLEGFRALQRIGAAFAASSLVPDQYRGNVANCLIAIEMAARMGASPLMVMQNLYLVHGRPSWSSQYAIASFNNCGRFTAIKYRWVGERGKPSWGCIAWAREKETGDLTEGPEVTIAMAKAEGWIDKKGSKWVTIPQLMLSYRAAGFLIRTTAPELMMGLRTVEESEDIGPQHEVEPVQVPTGTAGLKELVKQKVAEAAAPAEPPHDPATGEVQAANNEPTPEEQAEIRAQEAAEAAAAQK